MPKVRIKVVALGHLPSGFVLQDLSRCSSSVFSISNEIETFQLNEDAVGSDWEYTDQQISNYFNREFEEDFLILVTSVKLENNWYLRRLKNNRVVFTFYELKDILRFQNIPLKNIFLRIVYAGVLVYKKHGDRIPTSLEQTDYAHDETRGCLFDMNPSKWDVVDSCHQPEICEPCIAKLKQSTVSNELIDSVRNEIKSITKPLFYRVIDFVKHHPVWSLAISVASAFIIGVVSSAVGTYLFQVLLEN